MSTTEFVKSKITDESLERAAVYSKKQSRMIFLKGILTIVFVILFFVVIFYYLQKKIDENKQNLDKGSLRTFLMKTGIIKVAIGFFISTQVLIFINEIINAFVAPIIARLLDSKASIKELRLKLGGVTFEFGNLVVAIIRLMCVLFLVYCIYFFITINGFDIYAS